jgi:putative ABC transport system permease protein
MYTKVHHLGALTRAVRNISRRKIRALLIIVALGFSMAIMISIPAGIMANQEATQNLTENYNNTISAMEEQINTTATLIECSAASTQFNRTDFPGSPDFPSGSAQPFRFEREEVYINETIGDEIATIEGVKDVVPFIEVSSEETTSETMNSPRGSFTMSRPLYTITGVCLNSTFIEDYSILPTNITSGNPLSEGDSGVVLMSLNLSEYYGVVVGDEVEIYGESFTVVGIYNSAAQGFTGARTVYMNITDAQTVTDNIGNVSRFDVYAENSTSTLITKIATVIEAAYPELSVTTYEDRLTNLENTQEMYTQTLNNAESTLSQTQTVATQEILIAVAATSIIIFFVMLYTVRERTKEIGVLKAIGFSNWNVMSQFMLEGTLMSLMAGVVGIVIGSIGAPILSSYLLPHISLFGGSQGRFQSDFGSVNPGIASAAVATNVLDPQIILLAFGVAVLLGALGSLYPAWRAARTSPMEALRYE